MVAEKRNKLKKDKSIRMNRIIILNLLVVILLTISGKFLFAIILLIITLAGIFIQNNVMRK